MGKCEIGDNVDKKTKFEAMRSTVVCLKQSQEVAEGTVSLGLLGFENLPQEVSCGLCSQD